jgi:hypothetical protein
MKTAQPLFFRFVFATAIATGFSPLFAAESGPSLDPAQFKEPAGEYRAIHWQGFQLTRVTEESIRNAVRASAETKSWGAFELGPGGGSTAGLSEAYLKGSKRPANAPGVAYLSEEYFRLYRAAIDEGLKHGFPASMIYDEWSYPSGIVGGQFYSKYPELAEKSIELVEKNVTGPAKAELEIPAGPYVGAVMMNLDTRARVDVSAKRVDSAGRSVLACDVPAGRWKLMAFYLDGTFRPASQKGGAVDYLDREAVQKYIALNFEPYYTHLKDYFGTVIKQTFYDEPSMHMPDGRLWTPHFNEEFQKKYGVSPMTLYPALWYDIGPDTAAARNALFGFRAELYAENYIGQVAKWCADHGIKMAGHQDQEEAISPVGVTGDLMKVFQRQQIPGIDDIYYPGRSLTAYKIVTSAAFNYDWPQCIAETYAAYRAMNPTIAMRTAMDQFAMGVNMQMDARPRGIDPETDRYLGRLGYLLQGGRHVADVAVLYPIAALQSAYVFAQPAPSPRGNGSSPGFYYALEGAIPAPEFDYMDLGEMLYRGLRVDYTYLHPEILADRCRIDGQRLVLDNRQNREEFRVLIIPGGDTISADAAKRILEFYRAGGTVIGTSKLPSHAAEFQRDADVRAMVEEVFGISDVNPLTAEISIVADDFKSYFTHRNAAGGRGYFVPRPDAKLLQTLLKQTDPVRDVEVQAEPLWPLKRGTAYDGALTYIHKVKDGRDVYFFANSAEQPVDVQVALRGAKTLAVWNPHTGETEPAETTSSTVEGQPVTTVHLALGPVKSVFFVQSSGSH